MTPPSCREGNPSQMVCMRPFANVLAKVVRCVLGFVGLCQCLCLLVCLFACLSGWFAYLLACFVCVYVVSISSSYRLVPSLLARFVVWCFVSCAGACRCVLAFVQMATAQCPSHRTRLPCPSWWPGSLPGSEAFDSGPGQAKTKTSRDFN